LIHKSGTYTAQLKAQGRGLVNAQ